MKILDENFGDYNLRNENFKDSNYRNKNLIKKFQG